MALERLVFYSSLPCGRAKQIVPALFSKILWDACDSIMQKRKPGNLEVSAIGLGCMSMSFGYGPAGGHGLNIILSADFAD
jgi:hypothetical protein